MVFRHGVSEKSLFIGFPMKTPKPDVVKNLISSYPSTLHKVGMEKIKLPIRLKVDKGEHYTSVAECDALVSLDDSSAKGIHMSRLYITLHEMLEKNVLSLRTVSSVLSAFLESHQELSKRAFLNIRYEHPVRKKSLLSKYKSWRFYPVEWVSELGSEGPSTSITVKILYSSTCPCSAALSRQVIQNHFKQTFADKNESSVDPKVIYDWLGSDERL